MRLIDADKLLEMIEENIKESGKHRMAVLAEEVIDVINDYAEDYEAEEDYQRGLNDAWELTQKIFRFVEDGGMRSEELRNAFGTGGTAEIADLPFEKVMSTLTEYEAKKKAEEEEIKVGDEITVRVHSPERTINVIVYDILKIGSTMVYDTLSFGEGKCFKISWNPEIKKTGRHFPQVAELLDAMKEDGETNA